jgi:oligoribonuclease
MTSKIHEKNLIWLDLEMTGLDPKLHKIIEIATIVTDSDLNILAEGPVIAIYQPQSELDKMDGWNVKHHGDSGLIERVKASHCNESDAQRMTLNFLSQWVSAGQSPICGNTICQDRRFLVETMPLLASYFHYRNLDVSTLKQLCQLWAPDIAKQHVKESTHTALNDIRDSIAELRFYRDHWIQRQ